MGRLGGRVRAVLSEDPARFSHMLLEVWKGMLQARWGDGAWWFVVRAPWGPPHTLLKLAVEMGRWDVLGVLLDARNDDLTPRAYGPEKTPVTLGAEDRDLWMVPHWWRGGALPPIPYSRSPQYERFFAWSTRPLPRRYALPSEALMAAIEKDDVESVLVLLNAKTPKEEPVVEPPGLIYVAVLKNAFGVIQAVLRRGQPLRTLYQPGPLEAVAAVAVDHLYMAEWFLHEGFLDDYHASFVRALIGDDAPSRGVRHGPTVRRRAPASSRPPPRGPQREPLSPSKRERKIARYLGIGRQGEFEVGARNLRLDDDHLARRPWPRQQWRPEKKK